ncbi:MAG: dihydroxyacetone kinase transcriptional activator DhaS [Eubacterium coprostanoligenes]|uniref:dihydroxyacetone kinase transcriptional activator DhaS n=1 Tax=Eubacterium coprostanoligenes TaxID=290054 RepID=UPI0023EF8F4A|nr:dihydroxyacetone kinase transcriptional activator DhaS [Eubacterium coprostanoligenes]MCI6361157.1 dihydroxyacetone kinase transcriptional activator DhaS [Eubacterium coprostanoligenes]MDD7357557.1 dihydroxyacetone kinase transcriptional activator DhaS [Eubacterium coprostanoligenes]
MKDQLSCSEITKRKIAAALKELMQTTPFEKITVSDISNKCEMHRQTFYYHFQDRYELLDWLLYNEIISKLVENFSYETMEENFLTLFNTMYNDKKFYQNAVKINMGDVYSYLSKVAINQFEKIIKEVIKKNYLSPISDDQSAIAEFFGFGLGGVIISWVDKGMKETPQEMANKVKSFVEQIRIIVSKK